MTKGIVKSYKEAWDFLQKKSASSTQACMVQIHVKLDTSKKRDPPTTSSNTKVYTRSCPVLESTIKISKSRHLWAINLWLTQMWIPLQKISSISKIPNHPLLFVLEFYKARGYNLIKTENRYWVMYSCRPGLLNSKCRFCPHSQVSSHAQHRCWIIMAGIVSCDKMDHDPAWLIDCFYFYIPTVCLSTVVGQENFKSSNSGHVQPIDSCSVFHIENPVKKLHHTTLTTKTLIQLRDRIYRKSWREKLFVKSLFLYFLHLTL